MYSSPDYELKIYKKLLLFLWLLCSPCSLVFTVQGSIKLAGPEQKSQLGNISDP